jgi:hypothetical protein
MFFFRSLSIKIDQNDKHTFINYLNNAATTHEQQQTNKRLSLTETRPTSFLRSLLHKKTSHCKNEPTDLQQQQQLSVEPFDNNTFNRASVTIMNSLTAVKNLEAHLGYDLSCKLIYDYSNSLQDDTISSSSSSTNAAQSTQLIDKIDNTKKKQNKTQEELNLLKKNKADEYYHIEDKQANLIKLLSNNVYKKFQEENERQQYALCDKENVQKIFYLLEELKLVSELLHAELAVQIKQRLDTEWHTNGKDYFGDILIQKYQFYKTYNAILQRYPTCQVTLSIMLKKKGFSAFIKQLLEAEAIGLDNVNRIDMLLDRVVDFPRRSVQLLESYLKNLDEDTKEYQDIKSNFNKMNYFCLI